MLNFSPSGENTLCGNGSSFTKTALPPSATTETKGTKFICRLATVTVCRRDGWSSFGPSSTGLFP